MTRPYVIVHMASSLDGRVKINRWSRTDGAATKHYEAIHDRLEGDAWMCGRVTMNGYANGAPPPPYRGPALPRDTFVADPEATGYAIGLDTHGRMNWGDRNTITGDHVVVVLTEQVSDSHLAALREARISYLFGGADIIDVPRVMATLSERFGIKRLIVEGGGRINGSVLKAGCVDEISLLLAPAVDGLMGQPAVFDFEDPSDEATAKDLMLSLKSHEILEGGVVWLRYGVEQAPRADGPVDA